jgi:hypothetical protein
MAALTTRIRKMVPASRRVTDASLEPPDSIARIRTRRGRRTSAAGGASMAVTGPDSSIGRRGATVRPAYQLFVKIGLGERSFRGMRSMNPEPRDSGFALSRAPE